jgi:DNA modification methylase
LLALLTDGWLIRGKVVWAKTNPLPESAADRLSRTHEYLYHLVRRPRYFFDLDSIRQLHRSAGRARAGAGVLYQGGNSGLVSLKAAGRVGKPRGKNPGDVWTIATASDRLGHQATFPPALIEPAIRASVPERICEQCDAAWTRPTRILTVHSAEGSRSVRKVGELARCDCFAPSRPGVVIDPFCGTNTVGLVAERLGRDWLGIELNRRYIDLANARLARARRVA